MRKTISFCFDDGFLASTEKVVQLFEARRLQATLCVMAAPLESKDSAHEGGRFGDWGLWRELRARGHDIAPHGWAHERLDRLTREAACASFERMFARFETELPGFRSDGAIFHTPYLALPGTLVDWLRPRTAAIRLAIGNDGVASPREVQRSHLIDCVTFGPHDVADKARARIANFAVSDGEWQVLVLHGIDGEGWGPLDLHQLTGLLEQCEGLDIQVSPLCEIC